MCQYSADDGCASDWHMTHLGMLANSGAGLVIIEATGVERRGRITHGCVGLYSDECEVALKRVIDHCHRIGTAKFGVQTRACRAQGLFAAAVGRRRRVEKRGRSVGDASRRPRFRSAPGGIRRGR